MSFFGQLLIFAITTLLQMALAPKPPKPKPHTLADFEAPVAQEGHPVPVVFGEVLISGANVVWYGDLRVEEIRQQGGKK